MIRLTDEDIEVIAREVVAGLEASTPGPATSATPMHPASPTGVFPTVDEAACAAAAAHGRFAGLRLKDRGRILAAIRDTMRENAAALAKAAHEETGLGRYEDKVLKNLLVIEKTPGLEDLSAGAVTGDHGLTLTEPAPFGVIGAITPSTNPTSTIICNAIGMLAAGNTVVFSPHPMARESSQRTVALINRASVAAGGPPNVVTCMAAPSIETAAQMMHHPAIRLLVVTGGGAVVRAAMASGKRAICAGPGNPPVVVDETADVEKAGRDIVLGASTDNNIICTDEKETICVASVADRLLAAMCHEGAVVVTGPHIAALERLIFSSLSGPDRPGTINTALIGRNADAILQEIGLHVPSSTRLAIVEVDEHHPLVWTEQMMPIMPFVRVPDAGTAMELALRAEGGHRHTAVMHSRNLDNLSRMAKACDCSIFVKNARSQAGLGFEAEGHCSYTIASPTGEGLTSARSFSRWRRCVLADHFRIT